MLVHLENRVYPRPPEGFSSASAGRTSVDSSTTSRFFRRINELQGAQPVALAYIVLYLVMAFFVLRWNRGVLPVASGLAVLFAVVAAVAAPAWFARDKVGFDAPLLERAPSEC